MINKSYTQPLLFPCFNVHGLGVCITADILLETLLNYGGNIRFYTDKRYKPCSQFSPLIKKYNDNNINNMVPDFYEFRKTCSGNPFVEFITQNNYVNNISKGIRFFKWESALVIIHQLLPEALLDHHHYPIKPDIKAPNFTFNIQYGVKKEQIQKGIVDTAKAHNAKKKKVNKKDDIFIPVKEMASLLKISKTHAYALIKDNKNDIKYVQLGKIYRVSKTSLDEYIKKELGA